MSTAPPTTLAHTNGTQVKTYIKAWNIYGPASQLDILIEEMSELTQAILKARRKQHLYSVDMVLELADVLICIQQLELQMKMTESFLKSKTGAHNDTLWDDVETCYKFKFERLQAKVAEVSPDDNPD